MRILGIETSCDETAAAVVEDSRQILSNVVASQIDIHREFGGVVPEVAARSHLEVILPVIQKSLDDAKLDFDEIDGIAVTVGPGLPGALLVGVMTARTLALVKQKPLYGLDHVEAHMYANFIREENGARSKEYEQKNGPKNSKKLPPHSLLLTAGPKFPILALIVSGGHTQLVLWRGHFKYRVLGQTLDDAVGEAFDKVAKLLGLGFPGGPAIAAAAKSGGTHKYPFPKAKLKNPYDFSFSGLKTAVLHHLQGLVNQSYSFPSSEIAPLLKAQQIHDTAASFQAAAVADLVSKTVLAYQRFRPTSVVIAGGVAANQELRQRLKSALPITLKFPPPELCTDNAAMIASLGFFAAKVKHVGNPLELESNPSLSM